MLRYHLTLTVVVFAGCARDKSALPDSTPRPNTARPAENVPADSSDAAATGSQYHSTGVDLLDPLPDTPVASPPRPATPPLTAAERDRAIFIARNHLYGDEPEPEGIEYTVSRTESGYSADYDPMADPEVLQHTISR